MIMSLNNIHSNYSECGLTCHECAIPSPQQNIPHEPRLKELCQGISSGGY